MHSCLSCSAVFLVLAEYYIHPSVFLQRDRSVKIPIRKKLSAASISKRQKTSSHHYSGDYTFTGTFPSHSIPHFASPSSIFSGSLSFRRKRSLSLDEGTLALELDWATQAAGTAHLNPSISIITTAPNTTTDSVRVRAKTFNTVNSTPSGRISWAQDTYYPTSSSRRRNTAFQPAYRMSNGV